ncbi:MAG: winged helix-turn-helix transcriptional regulator [Halodesulfurarchaeum sp.]
MGIDEDKRATLRRFAAIGAASPLAVVSADAVDENEVRSAITGYLSTTPGAHFSKIRDDLKLGTGETQYHLRHLVDAGTIETIRDGDYKRFYPAGRFDSFEKVTLGFLRRDTPRGILIGLLADPTRSATDIANRLDVSSATVSQAAAELEAASLLDREGGYTVENPEIVLSLVIRYADSFDSQAVAVADSAASLLSYDP